MIYSTVLYAGEHALTRLRLLEEASHVDRWLFCTARKSFSGLDLEPATLPEFAIGSACDILEAEFTDFRDAWANERKQRDLPLSYCFDDNDVILVSDFDEIHRRQELSRIIDETRRFGAVAIGQWFHYYKVNLTYHSRWFFPVAVTGQYLRETGHSLDTIRRSKRPANHVLTNGHHFSYLMTPADIALKLKRFSHQEYNCEPFTNEDYIRERIVNGEDLFLREKGRVYTVEPMTLDKYPHSLVQNQAVWRDWTEPY